MVAVCAEGQQKSLDEEQRIGCRSHHPTTDHVERSNVAGRTWRMVANGLYGSF